MNPSILPRVAEGDVQAVHECLDRYGALVWSLARRWTRSPSDAEDATQDIFLQIWLQANRFDAALGSEKTFISMIARRRLIDRLRKTAAEPRLDCDMETLESIAGSEPRDAAEASLDIERVMWALGDLRPDHRRVVELGFLHDFSHAEIANHLDLPLGTVKSFMRRGLARVRQCMHGDRAPATPRRMFVTALDAAFGG